MKRMKTLQRIIGTGMILFLLVGCSANSKNVPSKVEATQAPVVRNGPKTGHWEGEPSVSFDITGEGMIQNLRITASAGMDTCNLEIGEIEIGSDGAFVSSEWIEYSDVLRGFVNHGVDLGAAAPATKQGDSGELVES